MIPKDKAMDMVRDFKQGQKPIEEAKENALICVENILKNESYFFDTYQKTKYINYWQEVKQFIEKL
jgi:hypothetical protein